MHTCCSATDINHGAGRQIVLLPLYNTVCRSHGTRNPADGNPVSLYSAIAAVLHISAVVRC